MVDETTWASGTASVRPSAAGRDYSFSLRLRVDAPGELWQAAAMLCMTRSGLCQEEIEELIGPMEDPSIPDCLMILALPERIAGCTRLDTEITSGTPPQVPAFALADWATSEASVRRS